MISSSSPVLMRDDLTLVDRRRRREEEEKKKKKRERERENDDDDDDCGEVKGRNRARQRGAR